MYIISPTKALCEERFLDWSTRLAKTLSVWSGLGLIVLSMGWFPSPFFLQASVDSKVPLEFRQLGYYLLWLPGLASSIFLPWSLKKKPQAFL